MPAGLPAPAPLFARAAIASATTDGAVISAVTGLRIYVLSVVVSCAGTATTVTFNTKPGGAGTAIFGPLNQPVNGTAVLPLHDGGWFRTNAGEGLTVTTGTGSTCQVEVTYALSAR